jgi:hypothetical protein
MAIIMADNDDIISDSTGGLRHSVRHPRNAGYIVDDTTGAVLFQGRIVDPR